MISKTKIEKKLARKTNPQMQKLIIFLKKQEAPIWLQAANLLARPKRNSVKVNLSKLDRLTRQGETVLVPGKLLATGNLEHALTIAAFSKSAASADKLKNCKLISIEQLVKSHPKGTSVRLII